MSVIIEYKNHIGETAQEVIQHDELDVTINCNTNCSTVAHRYGLSFIKLNEQAPDLYEDEYKAKW